jgi:Tripartite tricarboxylate transporter TctB family
MSEADLNNFSTWLTAIMLLIFSTMVGIATQYPADARFMPFVVGIPGIALCLLQLALDAVRAHDGHLSRHFQTAPKAGKPIETVAAELPEFGGHTAKRELRMWGYFVAFIAGVLGFGFYVSIPIMLVTFLRRDAGASWRSALLLGIGATAVLYVMFGVILQIRLHPGFVTPLILRGFGL